MRWAPDPSALRRSKALLLEELPQLGAAQAERDAVQEARDDAQLDDEIKRAAAAVREGVTKPGRRSGGWRTRDVEQHLHHVEVSAAERICGTCGRAKRRMGEDITRTLVYVPAHFVEHEYHLEKYACGSCKNGVSTAPAPGRVIERSAEDASVLAHVVVSKYADHTPLHPLHRISRSGVETPVSTLTDWTAGVARRIQPLVDVLAARTLRRTWCVRTPRV